MSFVLSCDSTLDCEVEGDVFSLAQLEDISVNYTNTASSYSEGSYDEDRPQSRLTIIESPSDSAEQEEEFGQFSLESPDQEDDLYDSPHLLVNGVKSQVGQLAHTCEECFKTFSSPGKLRQHEYSHTGETPFECKIPGCDKKFTSKFKLKRHVLIHSQTKTFLCDICKRAFRRKDHLKNHEKVHDPGKTVYTCHYEACGRTYNSVSSFRKHQAMHSAEEGQLDCKICKLVLSSREELINHLKVHAGSRSVKGSVDKKFVCTQCDKRFFTRKDLKRHSVVHTGNREFSCPHCTQRFGRKDHMTRHAKKTHASFYSGPGQERQRTGSGDQTRPTRTTRKERSVSEPGPGRVVQETSRKVGEPRHVIVHTNQSNMVYSDNISYSSNLDNIQQKMHDSPPIGDFQRLMSLDHQPLMIKEEEEPYYHDDMEQEESDIKELLDDKNRIDLHSFMEEFAEKKAFLAPAEGEERGVKLEPQSRPSSPDYSPQLPPILELAPPSHSLKPRNVLLRTQSQDSITRTKNPVLPSIHAETCLVVPEPNQVKYPAGGGSQLLFGLSEEREDQLTELRGSLFLSEDYGHSYFQPWNN